METKDYLIAVVLIMVIIVGGLGFVVNFMNSQGGEVSILDNPSLVRLNDTLMQNLSQTADISKDQQNSTFSDNPSVLADTFLFSSMITAPKKFFGIFIGVFSLIFDLIITTFGVPLVMISGFVSIILIIVIFSIWRTIKQG